MKAPGGQRMGEANCSSKNVFAPDQKPIGAWTENLTRNFRILIRQLINNR